MKPENPFTSENPIVVFDGFCNLCNGTVKFILRNDHRGFFYFTTSQSGYARNFLGINNLENLSDSSVVLIYKTKVFTRSEAIIKIIELLEFRPFLLRFLKLIPAGLSDGIYKLISLNRYRIFGRMKYCMVPESGVSARFIP